MTKQAASTAVSYASGLDVLESAVSVESLALDSLAASLALESVAESLESLAVSLALESLAAGVAGVSGIW